MSGSVRGAFDAFFAKVETMNKKHGPFNCVLAIGDFFGKDLKEITRLMNGSINGKLNFIGFAVFNEFFQFPS